MFSKFSKKKLSKQSRGGKRLKPEELREELKHTPLFRISKEEHEVPKPLGNGEEEFQFDDPSEEIKRWRPLRGLRRKKNHKAS